MVLAAFVVWPRVDVAVSGLFYVDGQGFVWRDFWPLKSLNLLAYYGARVLGVVLAIGAAVALFREKYRNSQADIGDSSGLGITKRLSAKSWIFLLLALLVGPALVANAIFKDNWGRARPREIVEFGGAAQFSPPLLMRHECDKNCSFVSGDGAFGFFLPTFAYVVASPRRSRRVFWAGMALGGAFGGARIIMGAHFLSDVLFAAAFMLATSAAVHSSMFGWRSTADKWRGWFMREPRAV